MTDNKWIVPALGYVCLTGILGVTIKLALRGMRWPELLLWTAFVYVIVAGLVLALGHPTVHLDASSGWALATGVGAAAGIVCSFVALRHAPAVLAVPVMSAYPVVTVLASLAFLGESFTVTKAAGVGLVLAGVILLAR
jgi:drug/metabolite transporter (DMT)-like permease